MVPRSLSILTQHFGRGGRSGEPTIAILLVEASVYQLQKAGQSKEGGDLGSRGNCDEDDDDNNEDNDDGEGIGEDNSNNTVSEKAGPTYRKKVDETLRSYIFASECRRNISNDHFQNPPRTTRELSKCVTAVPLAYNDPCSSTHCPVLRQLRSQESLGWC